MAQVALYACVVFDHEIRPRQEAVTLVMFMCDIQCIRWFPALSVVSVRYSGPLWDVA